MAIRGQADGNASASFSRKKPEPATTESVAPSRFKNRSRKLARTDSPTSAAPARTETAIATPSTTARFVRQ